MIKCRFLFKYQTCCNIVKQYSRTISTLYVTGDKAKENYVPITPYMDFQHFLNNTQQMEENLKYRLLNVDVNCIVKKYESFIKLHSQVTALESEREEIAKHIKKMSKNKGSEVELSELVEKGKSARNKMKALKKELYPVEEDFITDFLNLPNELHEKCPKFSSDNLLYRNALPQAEQKGKPHLEREDLIDFRSETNYYLIDEASIFDLRCMHACSRFFAAANFILSINPDFSRHVILEACGTSESDYHKVQEKYNKNQFNELYLTGGGSFESNFPFVAKLSVYSRYFPLRFVSCGRRYNIKHNTNPKLNGLYVATQSNTVQTFVATECEKTADEAMEEVLNLTIDFYKKLQIPFRISYLSAPKLGPSESLHASIEAYSPVLSEYIEVGHVSNYKNYLSKRVHFNIRDRNEHTYPHIIGGPVIHVTPIVALLIENGVPLNSIEFNEKINSPFEKFETLFT